MFNGTIHYFYWVIFQFANCSSLPEGKSHKIPYRKPSCSFGFPMVFLWWKIETCPRAPSMFWSWEPADRWTHPCWDLPLCHVATMKAEGCHEKDTGRAAAPQRAPRGKARPEQRIEKRVNSYCNVCHSAGLSPKKWNMAMEIVSFPMTNGDFP